MLAAIIYFAIGLLGFLLLAVVAPGGSRNNLACWYWDKSDWAFVLGLIVFWPLALILILIARQTNVPTDKR